MTELAYDDRNTDFSTSNTTKLVTTNADPNAPAIIPGLSVSEVGAGDPVVVEFSCPAMANTSALMTSWFVVTAGAATTAVHYRNWSASSGGAGGAMRCRMVLLDGVSYTFKVGLSATSGTTTARGAVTVGGVTTGVMYLRLTD
jgi:hypothetical protein